MNPDAIVDMLEPLRTPGAVGWWPPAPGWWVLAIMGLALVGYALRSLWRFHRRGAPLRAAKAALIVIENANLDNLARASALAELQRRLAMRIAGRKACAGLTGERWAAFLNAMTPGKGPYFDALLAELAYQPEIQTHRCEEAHEATRQWLNALARPQ